LAEIRVETKRLADLKAEAGKLEKELVYARYLGSLIGEDGGQGKAILYETTAMGILVETRDSAQEVKIVPKSSPLLTFKATLEGRCFADILATNCLAPSGTGRHSQIQTLA